jgi:hypothetical protein
MDDGTSAIGSAIEFIKINLSGSKVAAAIMFQSLLF